MEQDDDSIFDLSAIRKMADAQSYSRGEDYYNNNYVIKVTAISEYEVQGRVRGNYRPVYKVELSFPSKEMLFGTCNCPVGFNCKHCVAVALYYINNPSIHYRESNQINLKEITALEMKNIVSDLPQEFQATNLETFSSPSGEFVEKLSTEELKRFFLFSWSNNDLDKILAFTKSEFPYIRWENYLKKLLYQDNGLNDETDDSLNYITLSNKSEKNKFDDKTFNRKFGKSPLSIIQLFQDEKTQEELLKIWFVGYIAIIKYIHECFKLRGLSPHDRDLLDEFYREIEFDKLKAEYEDNEDEFYYEFGEDEDEIYDELDLGDEEFHSYLNTFFASLIPILEEIMSYIQLLQNFDLENFLDHLLEREMQWLFKIDPTALALNPKKMENWGYLTSLFKLKLQKISIETKPPEKQVDYYIALFSENPTNTVGSLIIEECIKFSVEEDIYIIFLYIEKLEELFQKQPLFEIFKVWFSLTQNYDQENVPTILNIGLLESKRVSNFKELLSFINSEIQNLNVKTVLKNSSLKKANSDNLLNLLLSSIKQAPKEIKQSWDYNDLVDKSYSSMILWLENNSLYEKAFNLLEEFIFNYPKLITIKHYNEIQRLKTRIEKETLIVMLKSNPKEDSEILIKINKIETFLLKKGAPNEVVKIMLKKGDIKNAAKKVIEVQNERIQRDFITKIADNPKAKQISSKSISKLKNCLYESIDHWVIKRSGNRPDNLIADTIIILQKLSEINKDSKLIQEFNTWFKEFHDKYHRLRNLRTALNKRGIDF